MPTLSEIRASAGGAYDDLDDEELAEALHKRFYGDMPQDAFRRKLGIGGIPDVPVPPGATPARVPIPRALTTPRLAGAQAPGPMQEVLEGAEAAVRQAGAALGERATALGGLVLSPVEEGARLLGKSFGLERAGASAKRFMQAGVQEIEAAGTLSTVPGRAAAAAIYERMPERFQSDEAWAAAKQAADVMSFLLPLGAPGARARVSESAAQTAGSIQAVRAEMGFAARPSMTPAEVLKPVAPLPKAAGNINLGRISNDTSVQAALVNVAEKYVGQLDEARRGQITFEATREAARSMGMTIEGLLARRGGQAFNAEEGLAARDLLQATTQELVANAKAVQAGNYAPFVESLQKHLAVQEQVSGAAAEAGRALSAYRIMADAGRRAEAITAAVKAAGGPGRIDDVAARIAALEDDPAALARFAREVPTATTPDKLYFAWINSILSAPTTHAANLAGNAASAVLNLLESGMAEVAGRITGTGVRGGETAARAAGMLRGLVDGAYAGARVLAKGSEVAGKIEGVRPEAVAALRGIKGAWLPTRFLSAEDQIFRSIAYRGELNAQAIRVARSEGLTGTPLRARVTALVEEPTLEMLGAAERAATYGTFTRELGKAGQALQGMAARVPGLRYIVPFVRTPANLLKYAGERSPLAPLAPSVRRALSGADGPVAQQMAGARIVTGTAMATAAAALTLEGRITGPGPSDPGQRALWLRDRQPFSLRIGDQWFSYARLEPFATLFGSVAGVLEAAQAGEASDADITAVAADVVQGIAQNLTSKTFLSGPVAAMEALMDPERAGQKWIERTLTSTVPNIVGRIAEAGAPEMREARGLEAAFASRIPGLRGQLPMKRDIFGEPILTEGNGVERLLSPIRRRSADPDPVAREMLRLDYTPAPPSRSMSVGKGQRIELTPHQYERLSKMTGEETRTLFAQMMQSPLWAGLPDETRAEVLQKSRTRVAAGARARLLTEFPNLVQNARVP